MQKLKLICYINGALIGMITEYCFRVNFGYLQGIILLLLITKMIVDIYVPSKD